MNTPLNKRYLCRGKRVDNGEWIEGNILITENWASILTCTDFCGSSDEPPSCDVREYEVVYETVGQYTGLKDKNGKQIFEGDVVCYNGTNHKVVYESRFGCGFFGIVINGYEIWPFNNEVPANRMEVIGNIHDNPELIKGVDNDIT